MKYFLKLNMVSILYALMIFVPIQLTGNVYRISRLTGWNLGTVNTLNIIIIVIGFIFGTILLLFLTKKWMKGRKAKFWTVILWVPYFVLFGYIIASLFPITYEGDAPNPSTGLLAVGVLMVFPFYILIINTIGFTSEEKN
ncbi:hypothetical protein CU633_17205 [Bacillus sp. V3-13]|uniref:hypothetical protein n=1 Tax=Bacillus sp. V3-13 TaxID=2053728 RepID=UPI000C78CACA|nr:hypothetical protein [Bacillus sp. V3-13]PLR76150.1 hypothetical protein CU633_17205 [Bacillus sp. V3-13]